ncbi:unnamed protein product [Soboliphyme baturini]|uniref:Peptidase S1 domain-containing protein n=1 Tax=Soboliphyme baturini TaxID=241478 RepID=A0A183I8X7_9BILA|nr:unnamed protein product [Soboliphyme baturini]
MLEGNASQEPYEALYIASFFISCIASKNAVPLEGAGDSSKKTFRMVNGTITQRWDIGCLVYIEAYDQSVVGVYVEVQNKVAVVTLASALVRRPTDYARLDDIDILFGAYNLRNEDEPRRVLSKVQSYTIHPRHRSGELSYDIAVIFIVTKPSQNVEIRPCVLPHERPTSTSQCHIASWGYEYDGRSPNDRKPIKTMGVQILTNHALPGGERGHVIYASRTQVGLLAEEVSIVTLVMLLLRSNETLLSSGKI